MRSYLLVAISLLTACKEKDQPPASRDLPVATEVKKPAGPTGTPRPQPKLTVTLDGKPVEMATALAWKTYDGTLQLTVSSVPVGCDEVTGDMRALHDGEVTFDVLVGDLLERDGTTSKKLTGTYYGGMNSMKSDPVQVTGDGTPGQPVALDVAFDSTGVGNETHNLVVKGTIDALGCAPGKGREAAAPGAAMPATITVAGKPLPVRFARFRKGSDSVDVTLYTGGEACSARPYAISSDYEAILSFKNGALAQLQLGGRVLPGAIDSTASLQKALTITPIPTGAGEIEIKTAAGLVVNKYPFAIDGKVTVTACPN